jgi:bacterial/archaeal transporter family protein
MSWLLLTLISVFISSLANILQRVLMKNDKSNPYSYAIVFHFLIAILNLFFALLHGFKLPSPNQNLVFFLLAAILWGGGTVFLFKALHLLESSEVTILSSVKVIITILASIIFLHESFNGQEIIGVTIIFASIILVTNLKSQVKFNRGVIYALAMTVFYGLAVIFDVLIIRNYDPVSYLAVSNFLIGFILLLLNPKAVLQWKVFIKPEFLKKMLPLGIFSSTQAIAYYFALTYGKASQIASINQSQVIVTVLFAVILLKERDNLFRKFVSAVLVTIGVFLLK